MYPTGRKHATPYGRSMSPTGRRLAHTLRQEHAYLTHGRSCSYPRKEHGTFLVRQEHTALRTAGMLLNMAGMPLWWYGRACWLVQQARHSVYDRSMLPGYGRASPYVRRYITCRTENGYTVGMGGCAEL